jgi:hypothetical protein
LQFFYAYFYNMKLFLCSLLFLHLFSCTSNKIKIDTSTDLTCAQGFIKSLYRGQFDDAEKVMISNKESIACLKNGRFSYNQFITKDLKEKYKVASVIFNNKEIINDSVVIFYYKDPVADKNQPPLKLIKRNQEWLVDYAYSCSGNL